MGLTSRAGPGQVTLRRAACIVGAIIRLGAAARPASQRRVPHRRVDAGTATGQDDRGKLAGLHPPLNRLDADRRILGDLGARQEAHALTASGATTSISRSSRSAGSSWSLSRRATAPA